MKKTKLLYVMVGALICCCGCKKIDSQKDKSTIQKESDRTNNLNKMSQQDLQKIADKVIGPKYREFINKQTYMTAEEAGKRWGQTTFSPEAFRRGDIRKRSQMTADLVSKESYVGRNYEIVKKELGRHDGFFWDDHIPAYLVEDDLNGGKESWQIVFLYDGQGIVRDILINKQ